LWWLLILFYFRLGFLWRSLGRLVFTFLYWRLISNCCYCLFRLCFDRLFLGGIWLNFYSLHFYLVACCDYPFNLKIKDLAFLLVDLFFALPLCRF
jgi:hypothetical protein